MNSPPKTTPPANPVPNNSNILRLESGEILRGANTVEIEHAGQRYLLRVTRENKLILTK
ncbi:hemin uptake protein HemP [Azonexus caeni]|jgi:hemin uptake protein HemP|uniref:hemin uptake protein HemP n=1 Tax=Azonexus caeni TaxID=266126 RepID=UPI002BEC9162|nr:hemin uptake protein HemP [Azonexus sp.]